MLSNPFVQGVIISLSASITAALIWLAFAKTFGIFRSPLDWVASISGGGVVKKHKNFQAAAKSINKHIENTNSVKFMAIRGFPVTQETNELSRLMQDNYANLRNSDFRVLLADPDGTEARIRAETFSKIATESVETYISQIRESICVLNDLAKTYSHFTIKKYDQAASFRILLLDDRCFLGFYTNKLKGLNSPVLEIDRKGELYSVMDYYFDRVWNTASD